MKNLAFTIIGNNCYCYPFYVCFSDQTCTNATEHDPQLVDTDTTAEQNELVHTLNIYSPSKAVFRGGAEGCPLNL